MKLLKAKLVCDIPFKIDLDGSPHDAVMKWNHFPSQQLGKWCYKLLNSCVECSAERICTGLDFWYISYLICHDIKLGLMTMPIIRPISVLNSLSPGGCGSNFWNIIFNLVIYDSSLGTHSKTAPRWMPQKFTNDNSALVHVMVWRHQAESHHLSVIGKVLILNAFAWHLSVTTYLCIKFDSKLLHTKLKSTSMTA